MKEKLLNLLRDAGYVLSGSTCLLLLTWMASTYVSGHIEAPEKLPPPWFHLGGHSFYRPLEFFKLDMLSRNLGPKEFAHAWYLVYGGMIGFVLCLVMAALHYEGWGRLKERVAATLLFLPGAAVLCTGLWVSTQALAKLFQYQSALGYPWFVWHGFRVYRPYAFLIWYGQNHHRFPRAFGNASCFTWSGFAIGGCLSVMLWKNRQKAQKVGTSHGTAHWAGSADLAHAGLTGNAGVVLGKSKSGQQLCHDTEGHVLLLAPPRTGKGVGGIVPTLLSWAHSVVICDIKGENWGITAGYRKSGLKNVVLRFDPTAESGGARFNPLEEIRVGTLREVADTQNIADILVNPYGEGRQSHWDKTGYDLMVGTILHILYSPEIREKNLATLALILSDPERSFDDTLQAMLTARHDPDLRHGWTTASGKPTATHPVVASAARAMLDKAEAERSGVKSTALATLSLYRDPLVAMNTRCSDFRITDLMQHERPVSLYMVIPTSEICRTRPLYRMLMNMLGRKFTESMEFAGGRQVVNYRHRLLLLMDEFQALGQLDFFEAQLAFIAGYGIKALLVVQNPGQIKKFYGQDTSIFSNCGVRVVYTPNDIDEAEQISRSLGDKTEVVINTSRSENRNDFWPRNTTTSTQEIGRRLMTASEIKELPDGEEIIFVAGHPPIKANKIRYYSDGNFKAKVMAAPGASDVCKAGPTGVEAVRAAARGAAVEAARPATATVVATPMVETDKTLDLPAPFAQVPPPPAKEQKQPDQAAPEWAREAMAKWARQKKVNHPEDTDDGTGGVTV
jgi:type IV secretion system protein VirD4